MISVTILIPFPVSFSICSSITSLWFLSCLILLFWWPSLKSSVFMLHDDCFSFKSLVFILHECLSLNSLVSKMLIFSQKFKQDYPTQSKDLFDDGWVEVLCRLPQKEMIKCKLVSKSWNKLISDVCIPQIRPPSLYGIYFLTFTNTCYDPIFAWDFACIHETAKNSNLFFPLSCFTDFPFFFSPLALFHSSNGFLLSQDYHSSDLFYVCNPLTKQLISLPRLPEGSDVEYASLLFDPHLTVVCILLQPLRMLIYSSTTREWTEHRGLHLEEPILLANWNRNFLLLDGFLYCLSQSGYLLEFDVKRVSSRAFLLPEVTQKKRISKCPLDCIGLSNGKLHYVWKDRDMSQINVWTLHDSKWLPKHTINLLPFTTIFKGWDTITPIAFHPTSDVLFLGHRKEIFSYHPDNKKLECFYKAKKGTTIDTGHIITFPFTWNMDTLQEQVEPGKKNQTASV